METVKKWIVDVIGYAVYLFLKYMPDMPHTCEEWTQIVALIIGLVTLFGITLPKAWDIQKKRWQK
ncbi:MAG: hypothetical protein KAH06_05425 [Desulfobacterales bacterium]|nr:hypothetical protein [Desulfobacterales bacterium]